jgi:hypothetical protein
VCVQKRAEQLFQFNLLNEEPTAEASSAAILERKRLGMAIAAMMRMIATTINSLMSEKPVWLFSVRIFSPEDIGWAHPASPTVGVSRVTIDFGYDDPLELSTIWPILLIPTYPPLDRSNDLVLAHVRGGKSVENRE